MIYLQNCIRIFVDYAVQSAYTSKLLTRLIRFLIRVIRVVGLASSLRDWSINQLAIFLYSMKLTISEYLPS